MNVGTYIKLFCLDLLPGFLELLRLGSGHLLLLRRQAEGSLGGSLTIPEQAVSLIVVFEDFFGLFGSAS